MTRVLIWNENLHEQTDERMRAIYPSGIHGALAEALEGMELRTATFFDAEQGLADLDVDVLVFWAHKRHKELRDDLADRIVQRVHEGMGLVALHSSHFSKPFTRLMGTSCSLKWRVPGGRERLWVIEPKHAIAEGLPECIEIDEEEMYGEPFDVPSPDELVMISSFPAGGEVFRSGCCYRRRDGRVFYLRPGHETYPTYHHPHVRRAILNGAKWAAAR